MQILQIRLFQLTHQFSSQVDQVEAQFHSITSHLPCHEHDIVKSNAEYVLSFIPLYNYVSFQQDRDIPATGNSCLCCCLYMMDTGWGAGGFRVKIRVLGDRTP